MPIVYICAGRTGDRPINIAEFVQAAWLKRNDPQPGQLEVGIPQTNAYGPQPGQLEVGIPQTTLHERGTNMQLIGTAKSKTVTSILFTCAAVFYFSVDPKSFPGVWCHHALSGFLSENDISTAIAHLGNPAGDTIRVVYAHDQPADANYAQQLGKLINRGILPDHIIEIPSLPMPKLGVDYQGMLGY